MVETRKITDFTPDPSNANLGTERGLRLLDDSVQQVGLGRSIVVDKNGYIIAGNKTQERAVDQGFEDAVVVKTTGDTLVVVQRDDLDLLADEPNNKARQLAYYDNRVSEVDLRWDAEQLLADLDAGVDLQHFWKDKSLDVLIGQLKGEVAGSWDAYEHWKGLPAFEPGAPVSKLQMIVHFESEADRHAFAERLGVPITEKTNNIWWPPKERRDLAAVRFDDAPT